MIGLFKTVIAALTGVALGLAATWLALERGVAFGEVHLGPWTAQPRAAYADADPYTRAAQARTGVSPLSQAEGMSFIADRDSEGARLDPSCDYVISGQTPTARLWTLSSIDPDGRPIANRSGRNAISSAEIVRDQDGRFEVIASANARPGNWLPLDEHGRFELMLRFYDTTGGSAAGISQEQMPTLAKVLCP